MLGAKFKECLVPNLGSAWCQVQGVIGAKVTKCLVPSPWSDWCKGHGVLGAKSRD
jgi:hypothetical protein